MTIIKVSATKSTNTLLSELYRSAQIDLPCVLYAVNQTSGRGRLERTWESSSGKNLTISAVVPAMDSDSASSFKLLSSVSVMVYNWLSELNVPEMRIKWPNDIMSGDYKLAGILLERSYRGKTASAITIGLGLNVNQEQFEASIRATSLYKLTNQQYVIDDLASQFSLRIEQWLSEGLFDTHATYLKLLYRKNEWVRWRKGTEEFEARLHTVNHDGRVVLEDSNNQVMEFDSQQIQMTRA